MAYSRECCGLLWAQTQLPVTLEPFEQQSFALFIEPLPGKYVLVLFFLLILECISLAHAFEMCVRVYAGILSCMRVLVMYVCVYVCVSFECACWYARMCVCCICRQFVCAFRCALCVGWASDSEGGREGVVAMSVSTTRETDS